MKQLFLCLANATHPKGRILVVTPIPENGSPQGDTVLPPIFFLTAFGHDGYIPTNMVVDVLPLDLIEIDIVIDFKNSTTLLFDPLSLKIPGRMHQARFVTQYAKNLQVQIEEFAEKQPNSSHMDLLSVTECRLSNNQGKGRKAIPMLDFHLNGSQHSAPAIDAYLIESFETGNSFLNADKEVYVVLSKANHLPTGSNVILGVIH